MRVKDIVMTIGRYSVSLRKNIDEGVSQYDEFPLRCDDFIDIFIGEQIVTASHCHIPVL